MKIYVRLWQYLADFFLEWEMFQTKVVEKIKTHILCSITFFRKSCRLWDNVEKYGTARQATDENIIRRMLFVCRINKARIQILIMFNTYCFSTATIVTRKPVNVTFIRTLPVLLYKVWLYAKFFLKLHPPNIYWRHLFLGLSAFQNVNVNVTFTGCLNQVTLLWNLTFSSCARHDGGWS
jgi:hypothetical protein